MNEKGRTEDKVKGYISAGVTVAVVVIGIWCFAAGPCSGGEKERNDMTYGNRQEYIPEAPETTRRPTEVDINTKAFAAGKVNNEIRIAGKPQVEFRSGRWEVYDTSDKEGYYVVLDREAIWAVDPDFILVGVLNKEARDWTPQAYVPPSYNPDVDYETLIEVLSR